MHQELRSGFAFVHANRGLIGLAVLGFATTFLGNPLLTFLPVFTKDVFGGDVKEYTYLMASAGVGAAAGALVVAWLGRFRHMGRMLLLVQFAFGVVIVLFALTHVFWVERAAALRRRRVHGDGVGDALVAGAAECAKRDARPRDEHLHGGVPRRHAARKSGRRLDRDATRAPHQY